MEVPLSVIPIVKYNKEKLQFWVNGKPKTVSAPIKPYYYSYKKDLDNEAEVSSQRAKALSSMQERTFYKYEFKTRTELTDKRISGVTFEDNIPFTIRNRIDNPDIYRKYPHTNELKFLFLDIEQYNKPGQMFPTYNDRIISIAWCTNDRSIKCVYLKKDNTSDKKLLEVFIKHYKLIDPDVVVLFNKKYDMPTILRRCERNRIDTSIFSKNKTKPTFHKGGFVSLEGTLIYDLFDSVKDDQSLSGNVPNRGLKAVSDFFEYPKEREPIDAKKMYEYVGTPELIEYNKDDVKRSLLLFDIYWPNIEFNANDLGMPLSETLAMNITDLGLITVGDLYRDHNIIADGKNEDRYSDIFKRKKEKGESNYEGALVDIFKTGVFKPMHKVDYGSLYPTIMASFNLSPDTTTFLGFEPYEKEFKIIEEDSWFIYRIPDNVLKKTMIIQVSKTKKGFLAELVKRFLKERAEFKRLWKKTSKKKYRAKSDNRKVKANGGVYGIQGSGKHAYGFVPLAIATTGIGRVCAQLLIDILEELHPGCVVEIDTDGVYFSANNVDKDILQELFIKRLKERFKKDLDLTIDIDDFKKGYFYKMKNYVLEKENGELIFHGVAMKARNKDLLKRTLILELARAKLDGELTQPIVNKFKKLDFDLKYFAMNITLGMHMSQYVNPESTLGSRLALDAQKRYGIKPEIGNTYYYVKCNSGYKLLDTVSKPMIDRNYYLEEIDTVVEIFEEEHKAPKVDDWL